MVTLLLIQKTLLNCHKGNTMHTHQQTIADLERLSEPTPGQIIGGAFLLLAALCAVLVFVFTI